MADPISIIGLLGTVGSLTKTVLDFASSVRDAPKELEDLSRELASLHEVSEQLGEFIKSEDGSAVFEKHSAVYNTAGVRYSLCFFEKVSPLTL